jgi:hypothetical protein
MPFEPGNSLGSKSRWFDGALRRAIAQDDGKRLRRAAETLLTKAAKGEPWAIALLADRLDGRVLPQLPDQGDGTLVVSWVVSAPSTSAAPSQAEVIDHSPSKDRAGSHPADTVQAGPAPAIEMDGGVGGGGGTPTHTLGTPVPLRSAAAAAADEPPL